MTDAEDFIYQFEGDQREVMFYLHTLLTSDLNLSSKIRFRIPFYYGRTWICYMNPTKKGKVDFAFIRGNELSNSEGLLESRNRKQVLSVEFEKVSDIPKNTLYEVLQEAILLDETVPYASKRKGK